jgi:hypothetical protein
VFGGVVGDAVVPAAPDDVEPGAGQDADGVGVVVAAGQPFTMLKFRTTVEDADNLIQDLLHLNESPGGMLFKIRQDPESHPWAGYCADLALMSCHNSSMC